MDAPAGVGVSDVDAGKPDGAGATPRVSGEGTYDRRYTRLAHRLLDMGVRPNHFTLLQIPVFAGMIWAAWTDAPWWFFSLSWLVIVLDGGDGILARVGGLQSRAGAILDATMDTAGVAVVLWGASRFHPDAAAWFLLLFVLNGALYLQNARLDEKVVSYVRGPIILTVTFPDVLVIGIAMTLLVTVFLLVVRVPATFASFRAVGAPPAP